jgi:BirA family biotin operon repressor/biotin-[acetyl-CoA-carboxylase] ligase
VIEPSCDGAPRAPAGAAAPDGRGDAPRDASGDPASAAEALRSRLSPAARAAFTTVDWLAEVDSTNAWLLAGAAGASGGGAICIADTQHAGRGRRGRDWISPPGGNLYFSARWRFPPLGAALAGLGLVAGVVAAEAVAGLGMPGVGLKWPNDLVCTAGDGLAKLGGVLVEASGAPGGDVIAVVGIGINLLPLPAAQRERLDQPVADLHTLAGQPVAALTLAACLTEGLALALPQFEQAGLEVFAQRWAALDVLRGRTVTVHEADGEFRGQAAGIDADGALRIMTANGERHVHAGDVSVRGAA